MLERYDPSDEQAPPHDHMPVCQFLPGTGGDKTPDLHVVKTASSVMLTLVDPEESTLNEEEISLLANPCALWTVLVMNGPNQLTLDFEPLQHLSPCAQFLRGITASLTMQRTNGQHILDTLNGRLESSEDDSLFDDEAFTKSAVHHWAIRISHELSGSIAINLEHIETVLQSEIKMLIENSHKHEEIGIAYWSRKMKEETSSLARLGKETRMLREKVQENVSTVT